ncbi:MAG TPA: helix-turn-helix domain-containing protein [Pyrinomonadaceae bacterium]
MEQEQTLHSHTPAAETTNVDWVTLAKVEELYVARVLEHTRGNKQAAARILAVDRKTLDRMIKRHNIIAPHGRTTRKHKDTA